MDDLARLRAKRALVEKACNLYAPRDPRGREPPIEPRHCRWRARTGRSNCVRQCSRYAHVFFGGFGFCWQHAGMAVSKTGLDSDEADGLPVGSL